MKLPSAASILLVLAFLTMFAGSFSAQDTEEPDPVLLFNEGQTAHEKGDFEAALRLYDAALEIIPEFPEAEFQRGNALVSLKRTDDAEKAFRRALELRENWTLPMTSLGVLLVQANRFDEAEKLLSKAIQLSGINFLAYSALTDLRIRTNASPDVLKPLLAKIQYLTTKANPTASLWASRSALERALGDKRSARISITRAIELDPLDRTSLLERSELALADGDIESARADLVKLKGIDPNSSVIQFLEARIFAGGGEFERAIEIIDTIKPSQPEILAYRDKILALSSNDIGELEAKLSGDPKNPAILGRLCGLLRTESPSKALDYCRRASEAEPENLNHAIGYGAALVQAKKFPEAVSLFKRLLEITPENFTVHTNLATAYFQMQQFAEAKEQYIWILKKQPDLAIAYYLLAISHDRLEEYIDAAANYQQFLRVADNEKNQLEIEKVNLRMPAIQKLIKQGKGKKNG